MFVNAALPSRSILDLSVINLDLENLEIFIRNNLESRPRSRSRLFNFK